MKVVVISGGFDPVHSGHLKYISEAKKLGNKLVIALNSDDWLIKKKGKYFLPFEERRLILENFNGVDQVKNLIKGIKSDPNGRRHILSAWNPAELHLMSLPPCHAFSQFYVSKNKISCQLYQRSCDMFLGVPFNIASYSLFLHLLAAECSLEVGEFILTLGDYHIYHEHFEAVKEQISREPKNLPNLAFNKKNIFDYSLRDFTLENYDPHPTIKAKMNI